MANELKAMLEIITPRLDYIQAKLDLLNDWHIKVNTILWLLGIILSATFAVSLVILSAVLRG